LSSDGIFREDLKLAGILKFKIIFSVCLVLNLGVRLHGEPNDGEFSTHPGVKDTMKAHLGELRDCYNQSLKKRPDLQENLRIHFTVNLQGRVEGFKFTKHKSNAVELRSCVKRKIEGWTFHRPRGDSPVVVDYPLVFKPE
jgi:hypothetical protein